MKRILRFWINTLLAGLLALALAGCDGDDGNDGVDGADGADGADGQDAINLEDVVPLNLVLDLSNTVDYDAASGAVEVHFFLTDTEGNGVDVFENAYTMRLYVSELVPGAQDDPGTAACEGCTWNQLLQERTPRGGTIADLPGTLTLLDADTGEYTYEFADTLPATANVLRATVRTRWREDINEQRVVFANPVNASYDFYQADPLTELASSGADMVTTEACEKCHGTRIGDAGHGGGYTEVKTCNTCHNVNYMASRNEGEGDLAFMVHRIHAAGEFELLEDGISYEHVTYPQPIYSCDTCHGGAPEAHLAYEVPSSMNCSSCHTGLEVNATRDGVTGVGHGEDWPDPNDPSPPGAQSDSDCTLCHQPNGGIGGAIIAKHEPEPELQNVPEFDVTISMTPPGNGEYYVAGETPVVTVELFEDGVEVDSAVYTSDADGAGAANVGPGLHEAELFVYGPRADAVPVLTSNSTTDPAWDPATRPTQGLDVLLTGGVSTDPQVATNADGYAYQLMDNIGDLEPGTYMVRFEGLDYGAVDDDDYHTASVGLINFQVGTAEEEPKVSGDACVDCHADTIMHLEGAHPHHTPFDTDQCLGCHDLSENYGNYIGNRVHAVHRASATGDLHMSGGLPRDWSHITFPQEPNNCTVCHTNPDPDAPVWRTPDAVACGGCHGAYTEGTPADFPDVDPDQIIQEVAAANHMLLMGGDYDARENPQTQCIVCHGEGRIADLYVTHELVTFPPLVVEDPNE